MKLKAERLHNGAMEMLEKGDVRSCLKELGKLLKVHQQQEKKALTKKKKPSPLSPAWQVAEEYTLVANSEMVLRAAALDHQLDIQWLSREVMRFLGAADEGAAGGRPGSSGSRRSSMGSSSSRGSSSSSRKGSGGAKKASGCFGKQAGLKKGLKAMVMNNQAVHRRAAEEPLETVITLLQKALLVSEGVMSTLILYNLAVAFMACGRFEDTTEAAARALEMTTLYLESVKPPSMRQIVEEQNARNASPKGKGKKGSRGPSPPKAATRGRSPAAPAASKRPPSSSGRLGNKGKKGKRRNKTPSVPLPTEEELAEIARQERLAELRTRWTNYSTFVVTVASHAILCHHTIATLALWCGMEGTEQYHCELAVGCAKRYLPRHHPLQKHCKDRLMNVTSSLLPRVRQHDGIPPELPLRTQADFVATPCAAAASLSLEESPFPYMSEVSKQPPVPLSALLTFANAVTKPSEMTEYLKATAAEVKLANAKKKKRGSLRRSSSIGSARSRSASLPRLSIAGGKRKTPTPRRRNTMDNKSLLLDRLPQPTHVDPPVAVNGPQFVTKLARIAFERYEGLVDGTIRYLSTSGAIAPTYESRPTTAMSERPLSSKALEPIIPQLQPTRRESIVTSPATLLRANGESVSPPEMMIRSDVDLHRMSLLVKDRMPEVRFRAAQMIQRKWKYYIAHVILENKKRSMEEWLRKARAASDINYYYRRWKERLPAIEMARELRRTRTRARQLTKIQAFLYQLQSVEEWGRRCAALHERLLAEKRQREKERAAATMIQSVWRMYREKLRREQEYVAARKIQCQLRMRHARAALMAHRVHKRLMYREFLRSVEDKIIRIQRWYRACKSRQAVAGLLERKKKEIEDYLSREEEWFERELGHLLHLNPEAKIHKIMCVLRGAKARRELYTQWKSRRIIAHAISTCVLKQRGAKNLEALREERLQQNALRRRREEVSDAATRIQAVARTWLAKRRTRELKECFALMDAAALKIQRAFARHNRRSDLERTMARQRMETEVEEEGKLRTYAATRIQALWRGFLVRNEHSAYFTFLHTGRHDLARRIQSAWHRAKARRELKGIKETVQTAKEAVALERLRCVMATRIAATVRMFLVRRWLIEEEGVVLRPTRYHTHCSARMIQCAWRCYVSRRFVHQVRLATAYTDNEKVSMESLHAYATVIQAVVRGRLLNAGRVAGFNERKASAAGFSIGSLISESVSRDNPLYCEEEEDFPQMERQNSKVRFTLPGDSDASDDECE